MHKYLKLFVVVIAIAAGGAFLSAPTSIMAENAVPKVAYMKITAFSSSVDETDETPFYTANGTHVADGIVATNALPFGTKIKIPELFGNKVFTVEDRMAKRFTNTIDVWMMSKKQALRFGVSHANVLIWAPAPETQVAEK